ncbi:MAG: hypothetical protein MJE63_12695, partial [Proteobacteria bacterium]|nr:hypothetical protein [Pseudomonadota bacterium]
MDYFNNEKEWHYYRYDRSTIYPAFKQYVKTAKKLGLQIGICGNHRLENELCNNDNCCLFDDAQMNVGD